MIAPGLPSPANGTLFRPFPPYQKTKLSDVRRQVDNLIGQVSRAINVSCALRVGFLWCLDDWVDMLHSALTGMANSLAVFTRVGPSFPNLHSLPLASAHSLLDESE